MFCESFFNSKKIAANGAGLCTNASMFAVELKVKTKEAWLGERGQYQMDNKNGEQTRQWFVSGLLLLVFGIILFCSDAFIIGIPMMLMGIVIAAIGYEKTWQTGYSLRFPTSSRSSIRSIDGTIDSGRHKKVSDVTVSPSKTTSTSINPSVAANPSAANPSAANPSAANPSAANPSAAKPTSQN